MHHILTMLFYTYAMACGQMASTHACIYDLASNPVNGSQHCSKKDSALEGTGLVEDLLGDREDTLEIQMYGKTHIRSSCTYFFLSKVSSDTKGRLLSSARRLVKASILNSTGCMRKLELTSVYVA